MSHIDLESDLLNFLISQGYSSGDRLPTISELQHRDHLGLSASKIREQLEVARTLGMVEVRSKTGMRMKDYSFAPAVRLSLFFALANDLHNFELFSELRTHIELAFWHEACALLTPDDIAIMRQCIEEARQKLKDKWIRIPNQEHRVFHMTIFKRLHNPFVLGLLEAYWDAYDAVEPNRYADYEYHQKVWDYHERILNEICAHDFDAAQKAFEEHTQLLRYEPNLNDVEQP
ncbi:MAG: FCD domain-containing protein [Anaerolineae bacterium]|nr:FCD domain-containing protein [Anaerolineae bacterium]